ncbi:protein grainyhead isoform X1 [Neodiprion fabricii]|uniref:protein grainyhead isoform X1 n=1 Tax=Neodiprion fabricii TaxID=2872261 RepID=UPI001ED8E5E7|nr:protein grainyhead isoform X1 [Neodiprion fabricii]
MSTCADEPDPGSIHIQEALSPVEGPVSPASSSLSNHNQNDNDQVLLATMQPVNVLDLHEPSQHPLHHKFHRHHHHHHQQQQQHHHPHHAHHQQHHHHSHHHHQHQQDQDQDTRGEEDDDRVTPEAAGTVVAPPSNLGEHKMIDLIYNDGQKTVMYTHDKEIIYENEADRVQVVEYPPPPPSPPTNSRSRAAALHLHHYPQLQLQQHEDAIMTRGTPCTSAASGSNCATTTTVLVLSELVAADPGAAQLALGNAASLRAGRRSRAEEDSGGAEEVQGQDQNFGPGASGSREEEEDLQGREEAQSLQTADGESAEEDVHKRVAAVQVQVQAMEGDWRAYCEHPLSVATAAMLNLQQQHQVSAVSGHADDPGASYVYEYYKLPDKTQDVKLPPTHELWSTGVMGQKLLVQEPQGSGSSNRMETGPESSGSGELHHFLHQYNQSHSPGVQSMPSGLPLSPQSMQRHDSGPGGVSGVKREPEDLSSSRGQQSSNKRHKAQDSPTPPADHSAMYHHQHQLQVQQYGSPYDPYSSCSPRLQSAAYSSGSSGGAGLQQEGTAVYVTGDTLPPLPSSGSSSLPTTTASYTRYDVVPSSYAVTHTIRSSSSSSKALTVDLPSPDSGIGADAVTPRQDHHPPPTALHQTSFDYTELCPGGPVAGTAVVLENGAVVHHQPLQLQLQQGHGQVQVQRGGSGGLVASGASNPNASQNPPRSRPWHDFGRQNDADKIQIPKIYSSYGFKYHLEAPISTSQRREDDRITYINKGQFYGIALDYIPDPDKPLLKSGQTVKSVVMLMFREEKSPEDEIKAWQFWHGRQHSVKQRILDADTKNSVGLVGCIEEVAHNAIAVYWNPVESSAKINVAVQCLSTDFSSQKGVKGLPLHIQVDTYEEPPPHPHTHTPTPPSHRGYCQIKVFCDKGAERKTRDEERRAAKRKMTATGRKKLDELYHSVTERSEFYSMADLHKPPVLFSPPAEHTIDKFSPMELSGFYGGGGGGTTGGDTDTSSLSNGEGGGVKAGPSSPYPTCVRPSLPALKFHNHFPPDNLTSIHDKKDSLLMQVQELQGSALQGMQQTGLGTGVAVGNRLHLQQQHLRGNESEERVMLYVRQESEDVYTPLHVAPPSVQGLLNAIESKYKIASSSINNLYRKNTKGITAKIDDDMVRYYVDEDLFLLEVSHTSVSSNSDPNSEHDPSSPGDIRNGAGAGYDVTLIELSTPAVQPSVPVSVPGSLSPHPHSQHQHQHGHPHESNNT